MNKLSLKTNLPNKVLYVFQSWPRKTRNDLYNNIQTIAPSYLIQEVWKECNRRIFKGKSTGLDKMMNKIEASIMEVVNNININGVKVKIFSVSDDAIRNKWNGLKIPPFIGDNEEGSTQKRKECKWKAPQRGWYKLNFDGSSRGNSGVAGIGCCIHDQEEKTNASLAKPIGIALNKFS